MRRSFLIFLLLVSFTSISQSKYQITNNSNGWYMYFGAHKFSNKFGIHLEAQIRRNDIVINPQQLLLRTGINYHFRPSAFIVVGYCFVSTYPYGTLASMSMFPENRIWEQFQIKNSAGKFELVNRVRLEQRFVNAPVLTYKGYSPGDAIYSNRFRLLSRFSIPFKGKEINDKSFYFSAYNEFFISFGKNVVRNIFDQNRAYMALGYKIPKAGRIEIGYLNQLIFKSDGIHVENNNTLQIALISNIDFQFPVRVYKHQE